MMNEPAAWALYATPQQINDFVEDEVIYWRNEGHDPIMFYNKPFTRSNGSIAATIYERLTKASRRRADRSRFARKNEKAYRKGVYDTLAAIRKEIE